MFSCRDRQAHGKCRTSGGFAGDLDGAAVAFDDGFTDGQAKAGIGYGQDRGCVLDTCADRNFPVRLIIVNRVGEKIVDHLRETICIAENFGGLKIAVDLNASDFCKRANLLDAYSSDLG